MKLDLINYLTNALNTAQALPDDDDAAIESRLARFEAGGGGSGRRLNHVGSKLAEMVGDAAQQSSRHARRVNTVEAHVSAGDLHHHAGREMRKAGETDRANYHIEKARAHYAIAKTLQGDLHAGNAASDYGFPGKPTVANPRGSDANFTDRSQYDDERRRNREEAGGAPGGDALGQKLPSGEIKCPMCMNTFHPEDTVSGENSAYIICPQCHGSFKMADGDSIGVPEE